MYHVLVFSGNSYTHSVAVHLLTRRKPTPQEAMRTAEELSSSFREEGDCFTCVGYERLPIEGDEGFVAVELVCEKVARRVVDVDEELASRLEALRLSRLTLDYDDPNEFYYVADVLEKYPEARVYRTYRGFHVRVAKSFTSFDDLLWERAVFRDDLRRCKIDRGYVDCGLGYLANVLFDEKWWVDDAGGLVGFSEVEVSASGLRFKGEFTLDFVVEGQVDLGDVVAVLQPCVETTIVTVEGFFTSKRLSEVREELKRRFRAERLRQKAVPMVVSAYRELGIDLIDKCRLSVEGDGRVVVVVPRELARYTGRLIGKGGVNVRTVEAKTGVRVAVESEEIPEEEEMRRKLKSMLRSIT